MARPINGVTINGKEYLRDENDEVITFNSPQEGIDYLIFNGMSLNEIKGSDIEAEEYDNK